MQQQKDVMALSGKVLGGKYRLGAMLGAGGMGAVYAAENTFLRAPVAIKVLHAAVSAHPEFRDRFVQEAQAAAQVRHTNIVSVLDCGYDEAAGLLYIVQEFLTGEDLKHRLRGSGPLAPRDAIALLLPIMRALAFAHSKNVVHRDLKPDNIFLCETPDGIVPKLIDFGIAKVVDEQGESAQHTHTHMTIGTPHFMSPEQACGDRALDRRTDVWSLGVVLYNAISGQLPYTGASTNIVLAAIITRDPARIEEHLPTLPADVAALVHGALTRDRDLRYPTMEAFWQAARTCSVMQGDAPLSIPLVESAAPMATPTAPMSGPHYVPGASGSMRAPVITGVTAAPQVMTASRPPPAPPRRAAYWVAGGVLGALVLIAGFALMAAGDEAPSTPAVAASPRIPTPAVVTQQAPAVAAPVVVAAPRPAPAVIDAGTAPIMAPAAAAEPRRSTTDRAARERARERAREQRRLEQARTPAPPATNAAAADPNTVY